MNLAKARKDELRQYALEQFNVILDLHKPIEELRKEVEVLSTRSPVVVENSTPAWPPKYLRNKRTGILWLYDPAYADNPDLEPYHGPCPAEDRVNGYG